MKLAILGGGGVRMPAFVRAVLASRAGTFGEICLFEPDARRRDTICRLAAEVAAIDQRFAHFSTHFRLSSPASSGRSSTPRLLDHHWRFGILGRPVIGEGKRRRPSDGYAGR